MKLYRDCPDCGKIVEAEGEICDEIEFYCEDCLETFAGLGEEDPDDVWVECPKCGGNGQGIELPPVSGSERIFYAPCPLCAGVGHCFHRSAENYRKGVPVDDC